MQEINSKKINLVLISLFCLLFQGSQTVYAGVYEFAVGFSYSRSKYSDSDFSRRRSYNGAIGYHFTAVSGIEFSYEDATSETTVVGSQNIKVHDAIYSVSLVQSLFGSEVPFQPYFKGGIAQINRDITGTVLGNIPINSSIDELTGIFAVGLKWYFMKNTSFKAEAASNIAKANIKYWKDDVRTSVGLSVYF
jgi:hypothetical protein